MAKYQIYAWIGILFLFFSCTEVDEKIDNDNDKKSVRFNLSSLVANVEEEGTLSRSVIDNSKEITQLWCAILDSKEDVVRTYHFTGQQAREFYLEDIEVGKYSAIFMATTEEESSALPILEDINQPWIENHTPETPFEQDYLYKRVEFSVNPDDSNQTLNVKLPRLTGRVEVRVNSSNPLIQQLITKIEIAFDPQAHVYTTLLGKGEYTGGAQLGRIDITRHKGFFSLPGENLSGKVIITQQTSYDNPETFTKEYSFKDLNIVPGTISPIEVQYTHAQEAYGEMKVTESSYNASNSITMFTDSETPDVINARTFKIYSPLKVGIDTSNKKLVASFFAPVTIRDTKILIKFKRYSPKFYYLAHYDVIHPFLESRIDIPVMSRACKFTSEDGEQVWIPAQEDLSESNCELKIVYPEGQEYTDKIQKIKSTCTISFHKERLGGLHQILNSTPEIARHMCLIAINIGYMFSSNHFLTEFERINGLYDDEKKPIDKKAVLNKLWNTERLALGTLERNPTAQGLGAEANFVAMFAEHYRKHYTSLAELHPEKNQPRITFFHEIGHWLGYYHKSNMSGDEDTQSELWAQFCSRIYHDLCVSNEMPVPTNVIDGLPR